MKNELKILTPQGMLGYGIPEEHFWRGIDGGVDAMIVDSGSTDPGPYQLGLSRMLVTREAYIRDLSILLKACAERGIRLFISSAGGPGIGQHVDAMIDIIRDLAQDKGHHFKLVAIYSDVDKAWLRERLSNNQVQPCGPHKQLTLESIDSAVNLVAQMGAEPYIKALNAHPDVDIVISGRSYDPSPYAALCQMHDIDPGVYWHMGKIVECGANCAEPKGRVIVATVRKGSFDLEPMNPAERCTPSSVAAHTLYEKSRPDLLPGPGGELDLTGARYEALSDRSVRISGSVFKPSSTYRIKIEGASIIGHRTIFIGGIRDPILIGQLDDFLDRVRERTEATYPELKSGLANLSFHVYGKNGVMGDQEPLTNVIPHEVGLLGEVTAPTQELANAICSSARISVLHMPYPGQLATAGNFAIPLNPPENPIGPVCEFSVYHLAEIDDPADFFPIRYKEI